VFLYCPKQDVKRLFLYGKGGEKMEDNTEKTEGQQEGEKKSFDEILKDGYQSEFDNRIKTALEKAETDHKARLETAVSEAQKLAKMTAEQKAKYESEKRENELAEREKELMKRELTASAKELLSQKGLPLALADILSYDDAESCNKSVEAVEKAFSEAVKNGIEERLKGDIPPKKALTTDNNEISAVDIIKSNQAKR
jgi:serine phosphatase RsbU (regulator of sigma subunit)